MPLVIVYGLQLGPALSAADAQDLTRYRNHTLSSSLDTVAEENGVSLGVAKALYERPAMIQELLLRTPYPRQGDLTPDPVREVALTFYNGVLYQVVVRYDRLRMVGLTSHDVVAVVSETYGPPVLPSIATPAGRGEASAAEAVLARWDGPDSQLILARAAYSAEFQLTLVSKSVGALAMTAIREAIRLESVAAPKRAAEEREKAATQADSLLEKARTTNKAAFRP
jgi:hypothetical protein